MKTIHTLLGAMTAAALLFALAFGSPAAHAFGFPNANDSMFPPAAAAKPYINFDGRGFVINGKRTFVVAGEVQYPRIPRAMWRDRLLRVKRAGYNTIQTYVYWNYHEPRKGQFDFTTGNHDLNAFLQLIHSLGMYAIVRLGPYVNAEWDSGGLPVWLRFIPGLLPMTDNPQFYAAVTPYWNKMLPIVMKNQINHGGAVIMVQLENEHSFDNGAGGGTDVVNAYYRHYQQVVLKAGLQVPYFFSGLNHSDDPAGDDPFDTSGRTSPWYSTEFWTGWYGWYGVSPEKERKLVRATWKVIAYGGAGYTHYTMVGGTDFDTWNNNEQAASYDFGSPIGQAGDFRSDYYPLKRAALFATSFPDVLANSVASDDGGGLTANTAAVRITSRSGPNGKIAFLDNNTYAPVAVQVKTSNGKTYPSAGPIRLQSGEIIPVVHGYPVQSNIRLDLGVARILGMATQGSTKTIVIYGAAKEPGEMLFHVPAAGVKLLEIPKHLGDALTLSGGEVDLKTVFESGDPQVYLFSVGSEQVRILAMVSALADRTWFVLVQGQTEIICGSDYIGEAGLHGDQLVLDTEQNGLAWHAPLFPRLVYGPESAQPLTSIVPRGAKPAPATAPALGTWQADGTVSQAQSDFNDASWLATDQPQPMGADGDYGAYAWYRTKVPVTAAGKYQLQISDYADWLTVFVNGKRQGSSAVSRTTTDQMTPRPNPCTITVTLQTGVNTLAILTAHYGRNKLVSYYGPMTSIDAKGLTGPVTLTQEARQSQVIPVYRWKADDNGPTDAATMAAPTLSTAGADWQDAHAYDDVFHGRIGYAWFRAVLPDTPGPHRRLTFASIDDVGTVFLNGKQLDSGIGLNADARVSLDSAWNANGPNVLAVLDQNTAGGGGLGTVTLTGGIADGVTLHGWRMKGGEVPPAPDDPAWAPLAAGAATNVPCWYRADFTATPPEVVGPHPILRVQTTSLSRGFVWLNGHNLGRYPEVSRYDNGTGALLDGVYLPECWINPGQNTLMIFDEDGVTPSAVKIIIDQAASRRDICLTGKMPATSTGNEATSNSPSAQTTPSSKGGRREHSRAA